MLLTASRNKSLKKDCATVLGPSSQMSSDPMNRQPWCSRTPPENSIPGEKVIRFTRDQSSQEPSEGPTGLAILRSTMELAGLPDGLFSNQKSQNRCIWEGLGMETRGIFRLHSVYFIVILCMLWSLGIFCNRLVYFLRFGTLYKGISGNPEWKPCSK
jgi:hypothetical protein